MFQTNVKSPVSGSPGHSPSLIRKWATIPKASTRVSGLLDLPTETIILVFSFLEPAELFEMARLCRRFHFAAIPLFFAAYGIVDPMCADLGEIDLPDYMMFALRGLRISLLTESVRAISCTFRAPDWEKNAFREVHSLQVFLHRLERVDAVALDFYMMNYWDLVGEMKDVNERASLILALLNTVVQRSCKRLTIRGGLLLTNKLGPNGTEDIQTTLGTSKRPLTFARSIYRLKRLVIRKKQPARTSTPTLLDRKIVPKPQLSSRSQLERLDVQSPILLNPFFLDWTIQLLNSSPIKRLSFSQIDTRDKLWTQLLPKIIIPSLEDLTLDHSEVNWNDLLHFLNRHNNLKSLKVLNHTTTSLSLASDCVLEELTHVHGDTSFLFHFLSPLREIRAPKLNNICLEVILPDHTFFKPSSINSKLSMFSEAIRRTEFSMNLFIEAANASWLHMDDDDPSTDPVNHHVTHLSLRSTPSTKLCSEGSALLILPTWLAVYFPLIQTVVFEGGSLSWLEDGEKTSFLCSMREACPFLQAITIAGLEHFVVGQNLAAEI